MNSLECIGDLPCAQSALTPYRHKYRERYEEVVSKATELEDPSILENHTDLLYEEALRYDQSRDDLIKNYSKRDENQTLFDFTNPDKDEFYYDYMDDKGVMLVAVEGDGKNLGAASERLRDDDDVVLLAVKQNWYALSAASERLQLDKRVWLEAVKQDRLAFTRLPEKFDGDKDILLAGVKADWWVLEKYGSEEDWDNEEMVTAAVIQCTEVLRGASERLQRDSAFLDKLLLLLPEDKKEHLTKIINELKAQD